MPYSYPNNVPKVAMNWSDAEKRKCTIAANAVLADGGDDAERQAIFACIRAAGRTENPGGKSMSVFERLAGMFTGFAKSLAAEGYGDVVPEEPKVGESFAIYKQADGAYRWVGWVSNHFRDNDNPREILSAKAHRDFVAFADTKQAYPELWLWHVPGSRVGKADMVDFADGFLIESGLFDPGKESVAEALAKETDPLTMSHGFIRTKPMSADGVTDGYIQFEASITPKGPEANPWTAFETIKEAVMPLNENKKAFLAKYLPMETITALEGKTEELRKAAESAGVDWKAFEGDDATGVAVVDPAPAPAGPDVAALVQSAVTERINALQLDKLSDLITEMRAEAKAKADAQEAAAKEITALKAVIAELKKTDDQKIAETLTPKSAAVYAWIGKSASKSAETVLDPNDPKDKELEKAKPSAFNAFIENAMVAGPGAG